MSEPTDPTPQTYSFEVLRQNLLDRVERLRSNPRINSDLEMVRDLDALKKQIESIQDKLGLPMAEGLIEKIEKDLGESDK